MAEGPRRLENVVSTLGAHAPSYKFYFLGRKGYWETICSACPTSVSWKERDTGNSLQYELLTQSMDHSLRRANSYVPVGAVSLHRPSCCFVRPAASGSPVGPIRWTMSPVSIRPLLLLL